MKNTYSLKEAAELVGYSTRTLRRAIDAGELLAARQVSGSIRISRVELAKWWKGRGGGELFDDGRAALRHDLMETLRDFIREDSETEPTPEDA